MKKLKKLCYKCNKFRYLRGFTRKNNMCNLCLFKSIRKPIFLDNNSLESISALKTYKTPTADELNRQLEKGGYWFEE